jgi:hypothetical protein
MNDQMQDLARRAVACKHWRWMSGMLGASPSLSYEMHRVISAGFGCTYLTTGRYEQGGIVDQSGPLASALLPDFTDPATMGCLLEIVREAHKAPLLSVVYSGRDAYGFCVLENPYWLGNHEVPRPLVINAETEAEALVNALEAAP